MTKLTLTEVDHIAYLARLELTAEEKATLQDQLSAILDYAERLQGLDTTDVPPMTSALPLSNVMREDIAKPGLSIEEALANAPSADEDSFLVKPVL